MPVRPDLRIDDAVDWAIHGAIQKATTFKMRSPPMFEFIGWRYRGGIIPVEAVADAMEEVLL